MLTIILIISSSISVTTHAETSKVEGEVMTPLGSEEITEQYIKKLEELLELPLNASIKAKLSNFTFPTSSSPRQVSRHQFPNFPQATPKLTSPILRHKQIQSQKNMPQYLQVGFKTQRNLAAQMLNTQSIISQRHKPKLEDKIQKDKTRPGLFTFQGKPSRFIQTNLAAPPRPVMPWFAKTVPVATFVKSSQREERGSGAPKFFVALQLPEQRVEISQDGSEIINTIPRSSKFISNSRKLAQEKADFRKGSPKPFPTLATIDFNVNSTRQAFTTIPTLPNPFLRTVRTSTQPTIPTFSITRTRAPRISTIPSRTTRFRPKFHFKPGKISRTVDLTTVAIASTTPMNTVFSTIVTTTTATTQQPTTSSAVRLTTGSFNNRTIGRYAYDKRGAKSQNLKFPLRTCFYNKAGYVCCNEGLNQLMAEEYARLKSTPNFHSCSMQKIANTLQKAAEQRFGTSFESLVSLQDFAQNVHFKENFACKTQIDDRYIMLYGTAFSVTEENLRPLIDPIRRNSLSLRRNIRETERTIKPNRASKIARFLN